MKNLIQSIFVMTLLSISIGTFSYAGYNTATLRGKNLPTDSVDEGDEMSDAELDSTEEIWRGYNTGTIRKPRQQSNSSGGKVKTGDEPTSHFDGDLPPKLSKPMLSAESESERHKLLLGGKSSSQVVTTGNGLSETQDDQDTAVKPQVGNDGVNNSDDVAGPNDRGEQKDLVPPSDIGATGVGRVMRSTDLAFVLLTQSIWSQLDDGDRSSLVQEHKSIMSELEKLVIAAGGATVIMKYGKSLGRLALRVASILKGVGVPIVGGFATVGTALAGVQSVPDECISPNLFTNLSMLDSEEFSACVAASPKFVTEFEVLVDILKN